MFTNRFIRIAFAGLVICCSGCNSQNLSRSKAKALLEAKPVQLETSDLIALTDEQVACATKAGVLQVVHGYYGSVVTRTTDQGEKLGLHDLVLHKGELIYQESDDKEFAGKPQVRLNGDMKFAVVVDQITSIDDEPGRAGTKLAATEFHVKLQHACFAKPLKVLGHNSSPTLHFRFRRNDEGWYVEYQFQ